MDIILDELKQFTICKIEENKLNINEIDKKKIIIVGYDIKNNINNMVLQEFCKYHHIQFEFMKHYKNVIYILEDNFDFDKTNLIIDSIKKNLSLENSNKFTENIKNRLSFNSLIDLKKIKILSDEFSNRKYSRYYKKKTKYNIMDIIFDELKQFTTQEIEEVRKLDIADIDNKKILLVRYGYDTGNNKYYISHLFLENYCYDKHDILWILSPNYKNNIYIY